MQGNSILALAGLACKVALTNCIERKDTSKASSVSTQFRSKKDWLVRVADTIMVVFDGNLKPKPEPMQWCQQVRSEGLKGCN